MVGLAWVERSMVAGRWRGELVGVQAGRRRRSEVGEHGKGERKRGIVCGDRSSARARER